MVTANPTDLIEVLRQVITRAVTEAGQQQQHLNDIFTQFEKDVGKVVDKAEQLGDLAKKLKEPPFDPPDWWSLLVFVVVKIKDLLGDDRLTIGYRRPDGWSRMLTLNYSTEKDNLDGSMVASLGVAVTDPGVTQGISLQILKDFDVKLGSGALHVEINATGAADWQYVLGAAMTAPSQAAHCSVDLRWQPWESSYPKQDPAHPSAFEFDLGPIHLNLVLSTVASDPLYTVALGLGTDSAPGAKPTIRPEVAFGPALGTFIQLGVPEESYSPQLTVVAGGSPRFSLGHNGNG